MSTSGPGAAHRIIVRVSIFESKPLIWRQLSVASDLTLDLVHEVLQAALGWEDIHLHRFTAKDPYARISNDDLEQGWPTQWVPAEFIEEDYERAKEQATLSQLLEAGGGRAYYEYDFGDSWLHVIEVVGREPSGSPLARLIAGENSCPPEDCGGIHSYTDFVDALENPQDTDPAELVSGIWDGFDPHKFDQAAAEEDLASVYEQWSNRPG